MATNATKEAMVSQIKTKLARRLFYDHRWLLTKAHVLNSVKSATIDIFEGASKWGSWDADNRRLGLSERLVMDHPWNVVLGILGHETAHQMVTDLWPFSANNEPPHGNYFQMACRMLDLHETYRRAAIDLAESGPPPSIFNRMDPDVPSHPVLEKVRKLLALSNSPEPHEAAQALAMASRLMARHNIDAKEIEGSEDSPFERWRIPLGSQRLASWDTRIGAILQDHFFVKIVYTWEYDQKTFNHLREIELLGRPVNLHMARHVFYFLKERVEALWQANKNRLAQMGEKGMGAKNTFITQMLKTFHIKLQASEQVAFQGRAMPSNQLILAQDHKLQDFISKAYPRLSSMRTNSEAFAPYSALAGQKAGSELTIYSPVESKGPSASPGLIEYRGDR